MLLHSLLKQAFPLLSLTGLKNVAIGGVRDDSRQVRPGDLFIARGGTKADGRQYVADAQGRGASAVVTGERISDCPLPQVVVENAASAASLLANAFLDHPSRKVSVLGVTGTNGKTTTAYLMRHILGSVRKKCGLVGTVEIDDGRSRREASMTTPGAIELAELLGTMRDRGCWSCAMEVSSHALDQGRVAGVQFAGAAFTNLTGDHLDYHKTMEHYAGAKAKLFEQLGADAVAAINVNDKWSARMVRDCKGRTITWGIGRKGDYRAKDISITAEGSRFVMVTPDGEANVEMQLIGRHNIANALTAAALVGEVYHLSVHQLAAALRDAPGAPGRLEPIRSGQPFGVFVDYAHTDDGLENVLSALRPITRNKLRVVFGCGGNRDRTKRPRMARVAEKLADVAYLTSDNPRTEEPGGIIDEIIMGFSAEVELTGGERRTKRSKAPAGAYCRSVIVEADRGLAIERALLEAEEGDVVLLAGKGHENYQIVGAEKRHFDDGEEARRVLRSRVTVVNA